MTNILNQLEYDYFNWIISLVFNSEDESGKYKSLLHKLYTTDFVFSLKLDEDRYFDGLDLRYRFAYENNIDPAYICKVLQYKENKCSILEMMIALCLKCNEHIVDDTTNNFTVSLFNYMLKSLGLLQFTNDVYFDNEYYINDILQRFVNRQYSYDGYGGLFIIDNPSRDLRTVEIWFQMCWYLDTLNL